MSDETSAAPALKEIFDEARFRSAAEQLQGIDPAIDARRFLKLVLMDLEQLSLMQRLRRMTEGLRAVLPQDYHLALERLRQWAPQIDRAFVTLVLPDFVGCYGLTGKPLTITNAAGIFELRGEVRFSDANRKSLKTVIIGSASDDNHGNLGVLGAWCTPTSPESKCECAA